jgi:hypothetical protein
LDTSWKGGLQKIDADKGGEKVTMQITFDGHELILRRREGKERKFSFPWQCQKLRKHASSFSTSYAHNIRNGQRLAV